MDIKVTQPNGEEDVNVNVSTVFNNIYSSCDVENTNAVCVSRLIEFIRPFMMEDLEALETLRESLDPEKQDLPVSGEVFKEHMAKWSKNLAGSPDSESDFNRTPSHLNVIDDRELPYMHSTPRASLGDKLLRCKDLLNMSSVSGYSLSTSKLDASNNVDPDKTILEEEIKRLQHQLSKTINELTMVKQQLAASEECNDVMQSDIERLNRRLTSEQQVNEHLQKDKAYSEELRDEINMHRKTIDDQKKKLSNYDREIQYLKTAMLDLEEEKLKLEKKADHLSRQKQDILKENFELKTELESHRQQMADIKRINDELKMKFSEQKDLIDQLRDENDILNHQKAILEKSLKCKSSSSPLEQDSPSPPLGNFSLLNNTTAFNFPQSSRRKSKLPMLKNVLVKKCSTSSSVSTPNELTNEKPPLDQFFSGPLSAIEESLTCSESCAGATNGSHSGSEEENYWRHEERGRTSMNRSQRGESLQKEISKVDPLFASDSTASFVRREQIFLLEDEINGLKKSLTDLMAENNRLGKELKEKTSAHEELLASNFVLATNLETTKSKVDHLNNLLAENHQNNALNVDKEIQVDTDDSVVKELARDLQEQIKRAVDDETKSAEQMAEFMRSFGQLTMEKIEIENNFILIQKEKELCEQHFESKIQSVEKKLVEQENMVKTLNEYVSTVVEENERLEKYRTSLGEEVFCLKSNLEVLREKNQHLLKCITELQDENNRNQLEFSSTVDDLRDKLRTKDKEVVSMVKSVEDLKRLSKEEIESFRNDFETKLRLKTQEVVSLKVELEEGFNRSQQDFEQKEQEIYKSKETSVADLENQLKQTSQQLEASRKDFEVILKKKEQEISELTESLNRSLREEMENHLKFELECKLALKEEESNWIKDNLIRQLRTDYEEKIRIKEEEINKLRSDFLQELKLKDYETIQFREGLEKRLMLEFEEKLKHSIDGEEKMFMLSSKCDGLEKSLQAQIASCVELGEKLDSVQNILRHIKSEKEELETKLKQMDEAKQIIVLEKFNIQDQLKSLKIEYDEKCSQQQNIISQLNKEILDTKDDYTRDINNLKSTIRDLESEISQLNVDLDAEANESNELRRIKLEIEEKCMTIQNNLEHLKVENEHLNQQILDLSNEKDNLKQQDEENQKLKVELEDQLSLQDEEMKRLNTNLDNKIKALHEAEQKVVSLTQKCTSLEQDLNSTLHNLYDKTDVCERISLDWQNVESELKAMFATKLDLEQTVIDLRTQVGTLTQKLEQKENEVNKLNEEISSVSLSYKSLQKTKVELENILVDVNNNNVKSRAEIGQLKDLLEDKIAQLDLKGGEIETISKELKNTKILLNATESENSKLSKSLSDLRKKHFIKEKDLQSLNAALEEERTKNSMYAGEIALKDQEMRKISFRLSQVESLLEKSETAYQNLLSDVEVKEQKNIALKQELIQQKSSGDSKLSAEKKTNFSKQQITIDRLRERIENFEEELRIEKRKNSQFNLELKQLRSYLNERDHELKSLSMEKMTLEVSIADLKSMLTREETKAEDLNSRIRELEDKLRNFIDQKEKSQEDLAASNHLREELLNIQQHTEIAKAELTIIETKIAESKIQLENTREELQNTQETLLRTKEEEFAKCEGKKKNKFTLRGPHSDISRPTSPDSPSNDFEVNGLPNKKVIYQSSNSENVAIDIPNLIFSDLSDEFLEEVGLSERSPRKKFTKEDTEEKVTTLALRLFVNSKDVEDRFEKQKQTYKNKLEEFLILTSDISYRLRDHVCIGTSEPINPVFILLEELKLRVKSLAQSAAEIGILAYENRMKRCWNLVTNYMAMLRKENQLLCGQSSNLETTPTQTLRRRVINANVGNEENILFRPERRRRLASKCRYAIYTMGFLVFVLTATVAFHLYCRVSVPESQSCPLDHFITRRVTGIPPM